MQIFFAEFFPYVFCKTEMQSLYVIGKTENQDTKNASILLSFFVLYHNCHHRTYNKKRNAKIFRRIFSLRFS